MLTAVIEPGNLGVITLSSALGLPVWISVVILVAVFGAVLLAVEAVESRRRPPPHPR